MQAGFDDQGATSVTAEIAESQAKPEDFLVDPGFKLSFRIPGCVYIIQWSDDGPVKIGWSAYPAGRLQELQTANWAELHLRALIPAPCKPLIIERKTHQIAANYRLRGEWFDLSPLEAVTAVMAAAQTVGVTVKRFTDLVAELNELAQQNGRLQTISDNALRRRELRRKLGMEDD